MLAVGLLALKTALDAGGPWYAPEVTLWVYATTFVGGLILVCALVLGALRVVRTEELDAVYQIAPSQNIATAGGRLPIEDPDFEGLIESLEQVATVPNNPRRTAPALLEQTGVRSLSPTRPSGRRRARSALLVVLGPAVAAAAFAGISAILLPASAPAGFLVANYTLNTTFILTFSYGWGALLAYAIASIYLAVSDGG